VDPLSRFWVELRRERTENLPVVAALNRPFRDILAERARRAPWFLGSLVFHVLLFLILKDMAGPPGRGRDRDSEIDASLSEATAPILEEISTEVPEIELEEMPEEAPELEEPEPEASLEPEPGDAGPGGGAIDASPRFGASPRQSAKAPARSTGIPGLDKRIEDLRTTGLEVALVFDTTSSMWQFLDALKASLSEIVVRLSTLVPNYRLAVVAYRDKDDAYLTRSHPLSSGRYSVLSFIETCSAEGGGDVEEAVAAALREAIFGLEWAPNASRVIVLAGDAPPHKNEVQEAVHLARGFRSKGGVVHTIAVGRPDVGRRASADEQKMIAAFKAIAHAGGGGFEYLDEHGRIVDQMLATALGPQWRDSLDAVEIVRRDGFREVSIREHEANRDLAFFVARLRDRQVHHGVVDAIVRMADRRILPALADVALDEKLGVENRLAAVYALRRISKYPVAYDPRSPEAERRSQSEDLRRQFGVPAAPAAGRSSR
jgi:hypothetical protein